MANFHFERNLPHQQAAVDAINNTLKDATITNGQALSNPKLGLDVHYFMANLKAVQNSNNIDNKYHKKYSRILDIAMETGTGKTYTYTKTIFELNKNFGLNKFIIVVPTLAIKAGTVNFLTADSTKQHFKQDYGKILKTYIVESQKSKKKKKNDTMPPALSAFAGANNINKNHIHVLIINSGMINSPTLMQDFSFFGENTTIFDAIKATNPITIIDEPHRFPTAKKTFENILKFDSQFIIRYGATFSEGYENLLYNLTAVDAFNQDLVKGIIAHVENFDEGQNTKITLTDIDGKEAIFELNDNGKKSSYKIAIKESLSSVHEYMNGITIESLNKSKVVLSNGITLTKGLSVNPYSYHTSLQDKMISQTINKHFEIEKELLSREVRIKPLSLFFIDDIASYRADSHEIGGELKQKFEAMLKSKITEMLKTEAKGFYRDYLEKSLKDISLTHGGYFSKDNTGTDDKVEKEVEEILHDKQSLLSLDNPRRFIFSKWTLREGWDNPNVFQICKLRSSGSETSKLQEVGRGLRIPVNEYMSRVTEENFHLHYYVDFTEKDFIGKLIHEINDKSGVISEDITKLSDDIIKKIIRSYPHYTEEELLEKLDDEDIIKRNNDFKDGGFSKLKTLFPLAFENKGVNKGKIRDAGERPQKLSLRAGKYAELKALWEDINKKAILEYKIENEDAFKNLLKTYFIENKQYFKPQGSETKHHRLISTANYVSVKEESSIKEDILPIVTMSYKSFLIRLAKNISVNAHTLHNILKELLLEDHININHYLSLQTIRLIKNGFNDFLLDNAFGAVKISYRQLSNQIHPTAFTDEDGNIIDIDSHRLGTDYTEGHADEKYLFEEIFFDSPLEKENITNSIAEVIVFTKIPKNSIRIPVIGGKSYSPDFAYIVKNTQGEKQLNFIIETKNKQKRDLYISEKNKIKHAEEFFKSLKSHMNVKFKTQFEGQKIVEIIKALDI